MTFAGITGEELNVVRKHLSDVKGGKLAKIIYPATIFNLIISDDIYNTINSIASGATFPDTSTFTDALQVIDKYGMVDKLPAKVINYLKSNIGNNEKETLKGNCTFFDKMSTYIIFDNKALLETAKRVAAKEGFNKVKIYAKALKGDINEEFLKFLSFVQDASREKGPVLVLGGGEVGVKVIQGGKGGRAQHFAALMIPRLQNIKNSAFAAVASDGKDFIEGVSGALVNNKTMAIIAKEKIDYRSSIDKTDTFNLHSKLNTLLYTIKPTQINVFDIYIFCKE